MADVQTLERALRNAHKAGDTNAAKRFAWEIKKAQSSAQSVAESGPGKGDRETSYTDTAIDIAKSGGIGTAKGLIGLAGLPGDAQAMASSLAGWLSKNLGASAETEQGVRNFARRYSLPVPGLFGNEAPTSADIQGGVESVTGEFYKPRTTAGEYAETIGEFAPSAVAGPGGLVRKTAATVVPAVASEFAGQSTKGTALEPYEPYARVLAALMAGTAVAGGSGGALKKMREEAPTLEQIKPQVTAAYDNLKSAGIKYDAGGYGQFANDIARQLADNGLDPVLTPKSSRLLKRIQKSVGNSPEFQDMDVLRKQAGEIVADGVSTGNADKALAAQVREAIDNFTGNTAFISSQAVTGPEVNQMAKQARELARRKIIAGDINEMKRKAEGYVSGDESGLKNQASSYFKREGKFLTPVEQKSFKRLIRREGLLGVLSSEGSRMKAAVAPGVGAGFGFMMGGPVGAALGGGLSYAANLGARKVMERVTKNQMDDVLKTVLAGKEAQSAAQSLVGQSRIEAIVRALLAANSGLRSAGAVPAESYANR